MPVRPADLDPDRAAWDARIRGAYVNRGALLSRCNRDRKFRARVRRVVQRDPVYFFDNFLFLYDPRFPPHLIPWCSYGQQPRIIHALCGTSEESRDEFGELHPLLIEKSRDEGWSWMLAGASVWVWLFVEGGDTGIMTKVGAELDDGTPNSLFGKIDWIVENLPHWLKPPLPEEGKYRKGKPPVMSNPLNGNVIKGANTTHSSLRGPRLRRVIVDEAVHIGVLASLLAALSSTTEAPVLGSSVEGMNNVFAKIRHSEGDYRSAPLGEDDVPAGTWRVARLHFSDNPRKGKMWEARTRARMLPETFAQEQDISYESSVPNRVYPEWVAQTIIYSEPEWEQVAIEHLPPLPVYESWDFGSGTSLTAVVWGAYSSRHDLLFLIDYACWAETDFETVARDVAALGWRTRLNPGGTLPDYRIGDNAGGNRESTQLSWIDNLAGEGIEISGRLTKRIEFVIARIRMKLRKGRILASPKIAERYNKRLPTLSESMQQYQRKVKRGQIGGETPKPDKQSKFSHLCDCLWYMCAEIWCSDEVKMIPQAPREPTRARGYYQYT